MNVWRDEEAREQFWCTRDVHGAHATNAYLSMKHDVAKQAANEMALREVDTFSFVDQRISLAVVTISDEEG